MAETGGIQSLRIWSMRAAFVLFALVLMLFELMPLETEPRRWAGPDMLLVLCAVWTIRRPTVATPLLIGMIVFLADLLYQRPPGLMAAFTVVGCLWLEGQRRRLRELPFVAEWAAAVMTMTGVHLGYRLLSAMFLIPQPAFGLSLTMLAASALAYPVIALISVGLFGLRHRRPGEPAVSGGMA